MASMHSVDGKLKRGDAPDITMGDIKTINPKARAKSNPKNTIEEEFASFSEKQRLHIQTCTDRNLERAEMLYGEDLVAYARSLPHGAAGPDIHIPGLGRLEKKEDVKMTPAPDLPVAIKALQQKLWDFSRWELPIGDCDVELFDFNDFKSIPKKLTPAVNVVMKMLRASKQRAAAIAAGKAVGGLACEAIPPFCTPARIKVARRRRLYPTTNRRRVAPTDGFRSVTQMALPAVENRKPVEQRRTPTTTEKKQDNFLWANSAKNEPSVNTIPKSDPLFGEKKTTTFVFGEVNEIKPVDSSMNNSKIERSINKVEMSVPFGGEKTTDAFVFGESKNTSTFDFGAGNATSAFTFNESYKTIPTTSSDQGVNTTVFAFGSTFETKAEKAISQDVDMGESLDSAPPTKKRSAAEILHSLAIKKDVEMTESAPGMISTSNTSNLVPVNNFGIDMSYIAEIVARINTTDPIQQRPVTDEVEMTEASSSTNLYEVEPVGAAPVNNEAEMTDLSLNRTSKFPSIMIPTSLHKEVEMADSPIAEAKMALGFTKPLVPACGDAAESPAPKYEGDRDVVESVGPVASEEQVDIVPIEPTVELSSQLSDTTVSPNTEAAILEVSTNFVETETLISKPSLVEEEVMAGTKGEEETMGLEDVVLVKQDDPASAQEYSGTSAASAAAVPLPESPIVSAVSVSETVPLPKELVPSIPKGEAESLETTKKSTVTIRPSLIDRPKRRSMPKPAKVAAVTKARPAKKPESAEDREIKALRKRIEELESQARDDNREWANDRSRSYDCLREVQEKDRQLADQERRMNRLIHENEELKAENQALKDDAANSASRTSKKARTADKQIQTHRRRPTQAVPAPVEFDITPYITTMQTKTQSYWDTLKSAFNMNAHKLMLLLIFIVLGLVALLWLDTIVSFTGGALKGLIPVATSVGLYTSAAQGATFLPSASSLPSATMKRSPAATDAIIIPRPPVSTAQYVVDLSSIEQSIPTPKHCIPIICDYDQYVQVLEDGAIWCRNDLKSREMVGPFRESPTRRFFGLLAPKSPFEDDEYRESCITRVIKWSLGAVKSGASTLRTFALTVIYENPERFLE